LLFQAPQYRCENGHCFDRAKEGYVNLLPAHRKHSADPGDDKHMLRSRREFLQSDYYRPLAERVAALCAAERQPDLDTPFSLLDIGCGEGYYTAVVADRLRASGQTKRLWIGGIDISKDAARMAAKRYRQVDVAVASNAEIPLPSDFVDCVLRIFAPSYAAEVRRIMKPGGLLITVTPGERHLHALRQLIYQQPSLHRSPVVEIAGLRHVQRERLDAVIEVSGKGACERLLAMTPYFWQASAEKQRHIASLDRLRVETSFCIDAYRCDAAVTPNH
jgi:23S rRNA (guanine745-N1)-methyltransferase